MIKNKLIGNKNVQKEFDKEDIASANDEDQDEEGERDWDDDMEDFDNLMSQSVAEAEKLKEEE
jgi:hypothetical protein